MGEIDMDYFKSFQPGDRLLLVLEYVSNETEIIIKIMHPVINTDGYLIYNNNNNPILSNRYSLQYHIESKVVIFHEYGCQNRVVRIAHLYESDSNYFLK